MLKNIFSICVFIFIITSTFAQNTISRLYDIETGLLDATRDLKWDETGILLAVDHFCDHDTIFSNCTSLVRFNPSNDIIQSITLDTLFPNGDNRLLLFNSTIYLTGHRQHLSQGTPTSLLQFSNSFQPLFSHDIPSLPSEYPKNSGLISDGQYIYLFGNVSDIENNKIYGQIQKIEESSKELIWDKRYERSLWNDCNELQFTADGQLAFIHAYSSGVGAGGEASGYQLVKTDTTGNIINTFEFEDSGVPAKLLVDREGNYFFSSRIEPLGNWTTTSLGRINKLKPDMSELEWTLKLPQDPFTNIREYKLNDYIQTENGDIVACGHVWDASDGGVVDNIHQGWDGFMVRVSQEGELKWLRIYKNLNDVTPIEEYGKYKFSYLKKVLETESGGFIAAGHVSYTDHQYATLPPLSEGRLIWLLYTDAEGCLDGEECTEVIVLDNHNSTAFNIGTKWIYETETTSLPTITSYRTYEIVDTTTINDTLAYVIEYDAGGSDTEYMYQEEDKIYFWDNELEQFQLNFDFQNDLGYGVPWSGSGLQGIAHVNIDSVTQWSNGSTTVDVQHLRIENNGTLTSDLFTNVYKNIGSDSDLTLYLGCGLCDPTVRVTKLRCFENDSVHYNFVGYPCDTSYIMTNTKDINVGKLRVFPNPTSGVIQIEGLSEASVDYQILTISGQLIEEGKLNNQQLFIDHPGLYLLKFKQEDYWYVEKVVVGR